MQGNHIHLYLLSHVQPDSLYRNIYSVVQLRSAGARHHVTGLHYWMISVFSCSLLRRRLVMSADM